MGRDNLLRSPAELGLRKSGVAISEETIKKAFNLYMAGAPGSKIADECGVSARTVRTWIAEYQWKEEREKVNAKIVDQTLLSTGDVDFVAKEVAVRNQNFKLAQAMKRVLADSFLEFDNKDQIIGTKKGVPLKDIKTGAETFKIIAEIERECFRSSSGVMSEKEQLRVVKIIADVVNTNITDPEVRKKVVDGLSKIDIGGKPM